MIRFLSSAPAQKKIWTLCLGISFLTSALGAADIFLQIQRGNKASVGLSDFTSNEPSEDEKILTRELQQVCKDDLLFSRIFNLVENGPAVGGGKIDFEGWEKLGSDILLTGSVNLKQDPGKANEGTVELVGSVYELPNGNPLLQKVYRTSRSNARAAAHQFISDLVFRFTGTQGVSHSRILFSNDATGKKELYLIDYDGTNLKRITYDKSLAMLPRWSPDGIEILYTSYKDGNPDLFIYSLEKGKSRSLSLRQGLNSCASFSPDGKQILLTLSYEGSPNLYLLDRQGNIVRRLTKIKAADTSSGFSPDGQKIVFTSDRPGWPQIYTMAADGSNVKRLSDSGYCDAPVWSPNGDKIAYSQSTEKAKHDIMVHDLGTGQTLQLTQNAGNNENPSFSPDGRFLVFTSTRNRKRELFIMSIDGSLQKKLADIPGNSYTPSWGP